ncbi:MAG: hypothetical protein KDK66_08730, partial [Deltaproteobacteria bacterium]|nr:hypothetical protein [Deltaproteobacteria bacterium]
MSASPYKKNGHLPAKIEQTGLEHLDPLKRYLKQISQYPFLSLQEEKDLAKRF